MEPKNSEPINSSDNKSSRYATKKWYVIHGKKDTDYGEGNINGTNIKFETENIKSSLCNYSDANILETGDITTTGGDANTDVAFKNCPPFKKCMIHINHEHNNTAENTDITMPMYNLIKYSDN